LWGGKLRPPGFICSRNYLTNLEGAPATVTGDFKCVRNNLTSLKGAPNTVGRSGDGILIDSIFDCSHNNLSDLEGAPSTVYGDFKCLGNPLISLEGIPKVITHNLFIDAVVKDTFPEKYIRSLSDIHGTIHFWN